jgi:phenylacetate-CoA ligase
MIRRTARKLRGSAVIAAGLRGQRRVPFLPRERLEARRDRRVRDVVAYAARAVPYYRELFAREGIDPRDVRGAGDLDRLPVLDRDVVRARPELFTAETAASRRALSFTTSGSTGTPLRVLHDQRSLLANISFGERERAAVIRVCGSGFRPSEVYVGNETSVMRKVTAFYADNVLFPVRPRRRFVSVRAPIEEIAGIVNEERPDILVGYGGWIDLFFKTVAARGLPLHRPRMVMYMAEALPHGGREHIEGAFGIPVLSRYSAAEAFKIGFFCEERTGFHLHEDLCHVRIGELGEIVLSNLVNRATVLLNYPIGDVGSISERSCPCGRTFKLLSELEGRVEDILWLPDGSFVHPRAVWQVFMHEPEVLQYQLVQHEPRRFELRLATLDEAAFERALERARRELQRLLGPDARIDARRRDELEERGDGKFRAVSALSR